MKNAQSNVAHRTPISGKPPQGVLARRMQVFARAEDGSLIIFGVMIFGLMLAIGGLSFDLMRYEANRTVVQSTTDRAALAAASLSQSLDPQLVVEDYFAKAGMADYLDSVVVTEGTGSRKVDVKASVHVPLHFRNFGVFGSPEGQNDVFLVEARSTAMEAIGNVEISMVLDVSGSMGSYNRLPNLKTAAKNFVDTIYGSAEPGTVSTTIVPYSEQVTAGSAILSQYAIDDSAHTRSYCLNFNSADYAQTAISTSTPQIQALHIDPTSNSSSNWNPNSGINSPVCRTASSREILAWSDDETTLKNKIDGLSSGGWTSTDMGMKWGAALIDPASKPVLDSMIAAGTVSSDMDGRPSAFDDGETMKVIVVMTDGDNTYQHYMDDPYRSGDTAVYRHQDGSNVFFSIWNGEGQPTQDPDPECISWKKGNCKEWDAPVSTNWYRVNDKTWSGSAYGGDAATRMTWVQLWAEIPVKQFTDRILVDMGASSTERDAIKYASKRMGTTEKNTNMLAVCSAAKASGVTVFSVALETSDNAANRLRECASSPAHAYRVTGSEINFAFQSIASQINMLRLVY